MKEKGTSVFLLCIFLISVIFSTAAFGQIYPRFPLDNPISGTYWAHSAPGSPYHYPSSGRSGADDTYALDLNWNNGNGINNGSGCTTSPPAGVSVDSWDDCGKPVYAVESGTIEPQTSTSAGWVLIRHTGSVTWKGRNYSSWFSGYLHLQTVLVSNYQSVSKGQQIGRVGKSGCSNNPADPTFCTPHLHFVIYVGTTNSTNAFLESVDPGPIGGLCDDRGQCFTYGDLETTYSWGRGAIYNHYVDDSFTNSQHTFQRGGSGWSGSAGGETTAYGFYDHMWWTYNKSSGDADWAKWAHLETIPVTGTNYRIYTFIPRNNATCIATYKVYKTPTSTTTTRTASVNQLNYSDRWVNLGSVDFDVGNTPMIYLGDSTGQTDNTKKVGYDIIKIFRKVDVTLPRASSATPTFSLSVSPTTQTVTQGNTTSYTITVQSLNGFNSIVNLSVSGLPSGTCSGTGISPSSVTPPPNGSANSNLSVCTNTSTQTGTRTLTVTGIGSGLTRTTTTSLTVNPAAGGGDAWDPGDNTGSGAIQLNTPPTTEQSHGSHTLSSTDLYDWFKVYLNTGITYNFNSIGGSGDDYGELYTDTSGTNRVAFDDDSGGNLQFSFDYIPSSSAWYYLRVRAYALGSTCSYYLKYRNKSGTTKVEVRMYNGDDRSYTYVNGLQRLSATYQQDTQWVDITQFMQNGNNSVRFIQYNDLGGWTYGFQIRKNGIITFDEACGQAGVVGCLNNDQTIGIVYDKTITVTVP